MVRHSPNSSCKLDFPHQVEFWNGRTDVLKSRGVHVAKAAIVNILEDHVEELDVITDLDKEVIDLKFRAFEIKTVQLTL